MTTTALRLTPAAASDAGYLYRLTEETIRTYVEATWGTWNGDAVRRFSESAAADGTFHLVVRDGITVGALRVQRLDTHIQLDQLYIAKPFQRQGIGTQLIRSLIAEARAANRPLRLRVLRRNPAKALYERLGFAITETTQERHFMEYTDRRYLGSWTLCPELCIYEEGEPPASGLYRIDQVDGDIRICISWKTRAGSEHEVEFRAPASGVKQELHAAAGPTHMSISHISAQILDSRAFSGDKEIAYARRCASADGNLLSTVQVGYRADGTTFRNFQVYRGA